MSTEHAHPTSPTIRFLAPAHGNFSAVETTTATVPVNLANPSQQRNDVQKTRKKSEKKIVPQSEYNTERKKTFSNVNDQTKRRTKHLTA